MKKILIAFAILFLTACEQKADTTSEDPTYKVIGVKDGDTVELLKDGETEVVRLAGIDCPEKAQPFGKRAKQFTSDLCFGKFVKLRSDGKRDRYKRIVGVLIVDDTLNLNEELVRTGYAWHFKRYSDDAAYALLENQARESRAGLWADEHPIAPWNWRSVSKGEIQRSR